MLHATGLSEELSDFGICDLVLYDFLVSIHCLLAF